MHWPLDYRSGFPTPMFSTHQRKIEMRSLKRLYRSNYIIFLSKSQNLKRVQEERQIKISGISDHLIEVKQTKKNSGRKSRSKVCCRRGIYPRWRPSLDQKKFNLAIKRSGKTASPHNLNCIKKFAFPSTLARLCRIIVRWPPKRERNSCKGSSNYDHMTG